ncbi:chord-domain-containing protein [Irpex rosettiformis]|uniref:Chord-domain-containing protein n=1 Tax=Irpex rosettiformis TaxID=378272 RepID=A0ACB8UH32_9APHY|nr:chord-domain-containing protein [Irpex rosettiformis]
MPRCTRKGCGQDFDEASNTPDSCIFHSGAPVFHEGLKSWSCCQDVNKPVLDFDEFMKIPGCMQGLHTTEAAKEDPPKPTTSVGLTATKTESGKETFSSSPAPTPLPSTPAALPPPPPPEEEDDLSVPVSEGTICRRKGCGKAFVSDEVSRHGEGPESECVYHPKAPIFHEGSKGYLCCKRRVLEFDEFLKIEGCKKGRHVFAPKAQAEDQPEEFTDCRIDHYQTPTEVHVSVFAKKADQERSTVKISATEILLDLQLPGSKRFLKNLELYGPINPNASTHKFYGTKLELVLKKQDTRSWAVLEKTEYAVPVNLTFGVGGRTGTIGSKELILDGQNATRS